MPAGNRSPGQPENVMTFCAYIWINRVSGRKVSAGEGKMGERGGYAWNMTNQSIKDGKFLKSNQCTMYGNFERTLGPSCGTPAPGKLLLIAQAENKQCVA